MEDTAIRILDVIEGHNNGLDSIDEETRDGIIGWITEILEEYTNTFELGDKVTNIDLASPNYRKDGIIIDRSTNLTTQIYLVKYGDDLEEYDWVSEEKLALTESTLEHRANHELYKKWVDDKVGNIANELKELQNEYNKALFNLADNLNKKNDLLDWADKQLDSMANQIEKKDEIIRELSELLIKLSGKME